MAKWKNSPDLDRYLASLERLTDAEEYIGEAIHAGAGVVADAVRSQIQALPVAQKFAKEGEKLNAITSVQKQGLLAPGGFGISHMRKDGDFYNVKLGFAGYNKQKTKKYPGGQPNSVIARSICSGTSFRQKNDFVGRAVRGTKSSAERKMETKLDEAIKKLF